MFFAGFFLLFTTIFSVTAKGVPLLDKYEYEPSISQDLDTLNITLSTENKNHDTNETSLTTKHTSTIESDIKTSSVKQNNRNNVLKNTPNNGTSAFISLVIIDARDFTSIAKDSNEDNISQSLPSVFDLRSYNNTCTDNKERFQRACYILQNETKESEEELCNIFSEIIQLAYKYSCEANVPGDELTKACELYVHKFNVFSLKINPNKEYVSIAEEYTRTVQDVEKIATVVRLTTQRWEEQRILYYLPSNGDGLIEFPPIQIPVRLKIQETYVKELLKYSNNSYNTSSYLKENGLINIFPLLYKYILEERDHLTSTILHNLKLLATMYELNDRLNEFYNGNRMLDIITLSSAGILFFLGVILNGLLLAIFIYFREARSKTNVLLINLTVVDCLSLVVNLLVYYVVDKLFYTLKHNSCVGFIIIVYLRAILSCATIFSSVAISFQRLQVVSHNFQNTRFQIFKKSKFLIAAIWLVSLAYSLPHLALVNFSDQICLYDEQNKWGRFTLFLGIIMLCIIPVALVAVFSIKASIRLRRSVDDIPGERVGQQQRIKDRMISSQVLIGFIVLAIFSYVPFHIFALVVYIVGEKGITLEAPPPSEYAYAITNNLVSLCSCFNPLVLFLLSRKFRRYLYIIICHRFKRKADADINCMVHNQSNRTTGFTSSSTSLRPQDNDSVITPSS